ncbi:MAG: GNAT family N-acetyltransferase [Planctomycetota bacterium]|jgi:hypothetical protein
MSKPEVNAKIEKLRSRRIPTQSGPENFDSPLDADIHVERYSSTYKRLMILVDGQEASSTGIGIKKEQFGTVTLRVGCIGGVRTAVEHRFKGYSRHIMENCLLSMRRDGADMSLLRKRRSCQTGRCKVRQLFREVPERCSADLSQEQCGAHRAVPQRSRKLETLSQRFRLAKQGVLQGVSEQQFKAHRVHCLRFQRDAGDRY